MWARKSLMPQHPVLVATALVLGFFNSTSPGAAEPCLGEQPADILNCVEIAYESRNFADYADLLAPDFQLFFGDNPEPVTRDQELEMTQKLFADEAVMSADLEILDDLTVHDGTDPMTWVLNVRFRLALELLRDGERQLIRGDPDSCVLHVRRATDRQNRLEIFRWRQAEK